MTEPWILGKIEMTWPLGQWPRSLGEGEEETIPWLTRHCFHGNHSPGEGETEARAPSASSGPGEKGHSSVEQPYGRDTGHRFH